MSWMHLSQSERSRIMCRFRQISLDSIISAFCATCKWYMVVFLTGLWHSVYLFWCLIDWAPSLINVVWNSYLSNMSAELSASVSVLRDLLLFRDNQDTCYCPFETDKIAIAINCICTGWFAGVCVFSAFYAVYLCSSSTRGECVMFNSYFSCFMLLFLLCLPCVQFHNIYINK